MAHINNAAPGHVSQKEEKKSLSDRGREKVKVAFVELPLSDLPPPPQNREDGSDDRERENSKGFVVGL